MFKNNNKYYGGYIPNGIEERYINKFNETTRYIKSNFTNAFDIGDYIYKNKREYNRIDDYELDIDTGITKLDIYLYNKNDESYINSSRYNSYIDEFDIYAKSLTENDIKTIETILRAKYVLFDDFVILHYDMNKNILNILNKSPYFMHYYHNVGEHHFYEKIKNSESYSKINTYPKEIQIDLIKQLYYMFNYLRDNGLQYNDIHTNNILIDREFKDKFLLRMIDFETFRVDTFNELYAIYNFIINTFDNIFDINRRIQGNVNSNITNLSLTSVSDVSFIDITSVTDLQDLNIKFITFNLSLGDDSAKYVNFDCYYKLSEINNNIHDILNNTTNAESLKIINNNNEYNNLVKLISIQVNLLCTLTNLNDKTFENLFKLRYLILLMNKFKRRPNNYLKNTLTYDFMMNYFIEYMKLM